MRPTSTRSRPAASPGVADAALVTCAYLVDPSTPWVMQSLFLAASGDARQKGAQALETFAYRYPEGETTYSATVARSRRDRE